MASKISNLKTKQITLAEASPECPHTKPKNGRVHRNKLAGKEMKDVQPMSDVDTTWENSSMSTNDSEEAAQNLKDNLSKDLLNEYGDEVLDHMKKMTAKVNTADNLARHGISAQLRAKMIDWMIEVLSKCQCDDQTLFLSAKLLDRFFADVKCACTPGDLHIVGVTSIVLAAKYEEIIPLRLDFVEEKVTHGKITAEQIKQIEQLMVQTLKYWLGAPTELDFLLHYLQAILPNKEAMNFEFLESVARYLAKVNLHDYNLNSISPDLTAAATAHAAIKIVDEVNIRFTEDSLLDNLSQISCFPKEKILALSQHILNNAKNFGKVFPGLNKLNNYTLPKLNQVISNAQMFQMGTTQKK
eukprot:TRINITY_DN247_c0_g1_i4.p1 TRINITY_DN247_c0_g1~~TRINITY_DN247_c0_g1_i4.p1  ORF type:complete len:356 (-),score=78.34 TRINITY_DN247_c0_g1_i4:209-1276(-)